MKFDGADFEPFIPFANSIAGGSAPQSFPYAQLCFSAMGRPSDWLEREEPMLGQRRREIGTIR